MLAIFAGVRLVEPDLRPDELGLDCFAVVSTFAPATRSRTFGGNAPLALPFAPALPLLTDEGSDLLVRPPCLDVASDSDTVPIG